MSTLRRSLVTVGLLMVLSVTSCTPANPISAGEMPSGDPLQAVKSNLRWYIAASARGDKGVHCIEFDKDYYLIELKPEDGAFRYIWVDKKGFTSRYAVDTGAKARLEKCENGEAWFVCTQTEPWPAFPYYLVATPGDLKVAEKPRYRTPKDEQFVVSRPGIRYRIGGWGGRVEGGMEIDFVSLDLAPDGTVPGGMRPPKTVITESGDQVTFRFEDVSWPRSIGEEIAQKTPQVGMRFGGATLTGFTRADSYVELTFEVSGSYAYFSGTEIAYLGKPPPDRTIMFILFVPKR